MKLFPLKIGSLPLKAFALYLVLSLVLLLTPATWTNPVRQAVLFPFTLAQRAFLGALRAGENASSRLGGQAGSAEISEKIRRLQRQVTELKVQLAEETSRRTAAESLLAQMAKLTPEAQRSAIPATIISYDPSPYRRIAVLNKGTKSGILPGSAVLWNGIVVGRVEAEERSPRRKRKTPSPGPWTCRVLLLGDPECRVAVRCARSRARGILEGLGGSACTVKYVDLAADIKRGDLFVSAGIDNIFPADHLVGECVTVSTESGDFFKHVEVRPAFGLTQLDEVVVLLPEKAASAAKKEGQE